MLEINITGSDTYETKEILICIRSNSGDSLLSNDPL